MNGAAPNGSAGPSGQNGIHDGSGSQNGHAKDHTSQSRFPRLSRPVELMRDSYDVVVIGSGYGGGVAASRMARGGQSVCVLERGKEKWPGEYPEKISDALKELHISGEFAPGDRRGDRGTLVEGGDPTGLYHLIVGDGQNVFVGNALGGTSLLNANVFLEAHPKVLEWELWPPELRGLPAWKKYYDRAREVLEPVEYPQTFPRLPKANLLHKQAELMGWKDNFYYVPQTTRFSDGPNSTGVYMRTSTLSGQDATGVNDGSKSTTLVTYITDAWNWGAEIFCECEVRYITEAPDREGYLVYFGWHSHKRTAFDNFYQDLMWVHAKKLVFLGAGTLGTTEILLRSKAMGLEISDDLGTEMSGNGDMLAFGYNTDHIVNAIGRPNPPPDRPVGPCITSVIDRRDESNPLDGFVIEDCAIPQGLAPIMFPMLEQLGLPQRIRSIPASISSSTVSKTAMKIFSRLGSRLLGPYFSSGSIDRSPAYLIMSHDSSQGSLTLKNDKPVLRYSGVGDSKSVSRIHEILEKATAAVGGTFVPSPFYAALGHQQITVHPIGGARLSKDNTNFEGVTNHMGEVLKKSGLATQHGLVVCDASVIPAALGVNPFATITAFAERSVELVAQKHGINIDYDTKNGLLNLFGQPRVSLAQPKDIKRMAKTIAKASDAGVAGIAFSEVMSGFIHIGDEIETSSVQAATEVARSRGESASFFLSVKFWDINELVNARTHTATLTGTFTCAALGGVFMIHRGAFQLFSQDPQQPETTNLTYECDMISPSGTKFHLSGKKLVNTATTFNPIELWKATTTLYTTITDQHGQIVGCGTLYIHMDEFSQEVRTLQPNGPGLLAQASSLASFLTYFTKNLIVPFLSPLSELQYPTFQTDSTFKETPIAQTYQVESSDTVVSTLHMWNPLGKDTSTPAPIILFIPGAAVDHQIYALPTIKKNAIDYFCEAGYRSYSITHRVGRTVVARKGDTAFDARLDVHAALSRIRQLSEAEGQVTPSIYVIAHCAGSIALACGLLDGTIPGEWIKGITASNVFMNPSFAKVNHIKASLPVSLTQIYNKLAGSWFDSVSSFQDTYIQQALNQVLRFYPVGEARESCRSVVCHRSELVYGRLWSHRNLNQATHAHLESFLGGTAMNTLAYFVSSGNLGYVTTNAPASTNLVTPENLRRLKGIPILFISGAENAVYTAENTDVSYTTLCNEHGRQWYEREVFETRGHLDCWMGATAYMDVYSRVRAHVDNVMLKNMFGDKYSDGG